MLNLKNYYYKTTVKFSGHCKENQKVLVDHFWDELSFDNILEKCRQGFSRCGYDNFLVNSSEKTKFNTLLRILFSFLNNPDSELTIFVNFYNAEFELVIKLPFLKFVTSVEKDNFIDIIRNSDSFLLRGKEKGKFYISANLFPLVKLAGVSTEETSI